MNQPSGVEGSAPSRPSEDVACTIVSKNYLSYARVLARSFKQQHPDIPFVVLLCDTIDGYFDPANEPFDIVLLEELDIPDFEIFSFQYIIIELNTAAKPYFLEHLIRTRGHRRVLYFDPDIFIFQPVTPMFDILSSHSIALTPHLTKPLPDDGKMPNEISILQAGAYNLGFIGLSDTPTTQCLLDWWKQRLHDRCRMDIQNGMHVDQRWIDFIPGFFGDVYIVRENTYNVAYWNIPTLSLTSISERPYVDGSPAIFMHFSGVDPKSPNTISKHDTRLTMENLGSSAELYRKYIDQLVKADYFDALAWPYAYGRFTNGIEIPPIARRIYIEMEARKREFGNPFDADAPRSYFRWLVERTEESGHEWPGLSRLLYAIHRSRPDLQRAFRRPFGRDNRAFMNWLEVDGRDQYRLAPGLLKTHAPTTSEMRTASWASANSQDVGVNVSGFFTSEKGVGQAARSMLRALKTAGIRTAVNNFRDPTSENRESLESESVQDAPHPVNLMLLGAGDVDWFRTSRGEGYFENRYNIGHIAWELARAPMDTPVILQVMDEVWVGSTFIRDAMRERLPIPVHCIPYPVVDEAPVPTWHRYSFGIPKDHFVFLYMLDFSSFVERKNPLGVVQAFKRAFLPNDPAMLVIKCSRGAGNAAALDALQREAVGANVRITDSVYSRNQARNLLRVCDCYVSLHRAEGFGLSMAEAMLLEKPVIATGYSGNMDFMSEQNSFPVRYNVVEIDRDYGPYRRGWPWAEPDLDHAAELMRFVYDHQAEAQQIGRIARPEILARFGAQVVGSAMRERLTEIGARVRGGWA
jgi:glycosyltransferase involved in cell wall biosynthesis